MKPLVMTCSHIGRSADRRTPRNEMSFALVPWVGDDALVENSAQQDDDYLAEHELSRPRRRPAPRQRFDPHPVSLRAVRALLAEGTAKQPSDVNFNEAASALRRLEQKKAEAEQAAADAAIEAELQEAATPRQLPFSLPPRLDRPAGPTLLLTCSSPAARCTQLDQTFTTTRKKPAPFRSIDDDM